MATQCVRVRGVLLSLLLGSVVLTATQRAVEPADASRPLPVSIGIVRGDGVLLPLATLRNDTWTALTIEDPSGLRLSADAKALARDPAG